MNDPLNPTLNHAPCGFLIFTDDGVIRTTNATLRALLGYEAQEIEGSPLTSILSGGGRVYYQTHLFPVLKLQGKVDEVYLVLKSRTGKEIPVLLNGVRRQENQQYLSHCILLPIHQRSHFEEELLQAKKAAEEANRFKEEAHAKLEAQQKELLAVSAREHRIAEVLQDALRPAISDDISRLAVDTFYQPAMDEAEIGGDFYDVFSLDEERYALVVADVSGKGLAAASHIATIRHMLRALLYDQYSPDSQDARLPSDKKEDQHGTLARLMKSLNDILAGRRLLDGFATLFLGVYDGKEQTLTYVNAGQEPGLLLCFATGTIEELASTGPVLGGFPGAIYLQRTTPFAVKDVLAVFTDGLTEAGASRKEFLEIEGVTAIFKDAVHHVSKRSPNAAPSDIISRMMEQVTEIVTTSGIRDDVCLLVASGK